MVATKKMGVKMVNGKPVAVDPDNEAVSPEQSAAIKAQQDNQSQQDKQYQDDEDAKEAYKARGYKKGGSVRKYSKGGSVRGAGCAEKGHGKGTMY